MSVDDVKPYDFSALDDMYLSADEYDDIANFVCNEVMGLDQAAWSDVGQQSTDNRDAYLSKYVIAQWRSFELEHAERLTTRRGRTLSFGQEVVLHILLRSDELDDDLVAVTSLYSRDELLAVVSKASEPWLAKYKVRLDFDSEAGSINLGWEIFIDSPA